MKVSAVEDKSQPFWCFRPPRSLPSSLRDSSELLKCSCGLLGSLAPRLWQEDEYEDEAKETDAAIEEKGGSVAKRVLRVKKSRFIKGLNCNNLQVPESLGDKEPTDVGGEVSKGVCPAPRVHWQHLGSNNPCETAESQVEGNSEAEDEWERQPGHLGQVCSCLDQLGRRGDIHGRAG